MPFAVKCIQTYPLCCINFVSEMYPKCIPNVSECIRFVSEMYPNVSALYPKCIRFVSECIRNVSAVSECIRCICCIGMYPMYLLYRNVSDVSTDPVRGTTEAGGTLSTEQSQILPTWYVSRLELLGCKS